ncbi:MAG TPA: MOSC N-terminal beta barrel domain-containing protein, partial [Nitrospiraceae bacterium]|nr:MOSC N-terminal beta barrel domain-containing protein [Nitrospiraceae bacterium]
MKITEIWRYPVKTMAGEKLQRARIGPLGIEGDRVVHVEDARERVITSRSHPRFLSGGPIRLNSSPSFFSGFSADSYAASLTVGSITAYASSGVCLPRLECG